MSSAHRFLNAFGGRAFVVCLALASAMLAVKVDSQAPPTETLNFTPTADTYVSSGAVTSNFGTDTRIRSDASPTDLSFLRFTVTGVGGRTVQRARLRVTVSGDSDSGGTIHKITNNTWTETGTTYNSRPTIDGAGIHTLGAAALNAVLEFNLDGQVTGDGTYNFAIDTVSSDSVSYNSREASIGKPTLVLTVAASPDPVVTIIQPPDNGVYFIGDTVTFQATAQDAEDGNLAAALHWSSSIDGPLGTGGTISGTLSEGSHVITATVTDSSSRTGSDTVAITVNPPPPDNTEPLVSITAPLDGRTFTSSEQITFTGTATDLEDGSRTAQLVWTSDVSGQIGTGGTFTRTLPVGTHHLTARATDTAGLPGTATITINVVAPSVLTVPASADAYVDADFPTSNFGTATFLRVDGSPVVIFYVRFPVTGIGSRTVSRAVVRMQVPNKSGAPSDAGGSVRKITNNTWVENTVTYNTRPTLDGTVTDTLGAVAVNDVVEFNVTTAITGDGSYNFAFTSSNSNAADYRSREDGLAPVLELTLTGNPPAVSISQPANNAVFFRNDPITFTGTANDSEDGNLSSQIQWSSNLGGILGNGASISRNNLAVGTHTITASATDSTSLTGSAQRTIRVRDPNVAPVVTISAPSNNGTAAAGTVVSLNATATDDFDGNLTSQIRWSSNLTGDFPAGASLNVALAEGTHTLTARVTDSDNVVGTASRTFTITPTAPVVTISAPAVGANIFAGNPVTFTGSATDATDGNVSASLVWTSNLQTPATIGTGASFSRSDLVVGTHTITATATDSGTLTGSTTRTVVVRPPNGLPTVSITSPADGAMLFGGTAVQLTATASDPEQGNLAAAVAWTSSLSGNLGTGSPLNLSSLAAGTHTITATVTDNAGASAQATIAVTVGSNTLTFTAIADTYADAGAVTTARGTDTTIKVDGSPVTQGFLRFTTTGIAPFAVQRAIVRLTVGPTSGDESPAGGSIHRITNNTWTEAGLTWNSRPTIDGPILSTLGAVALNQVVDFDVTSAVTTDGTFNFALDTTNSNAANYKSREQATGKPQLIITLRQNTPPAVTITAPANNLTVNPGTPITFTATATDTEHGSLASQVQWSAESGALGTGASITVSNLTPGTHTITARATDSAGASGQAQITVIIGQPPVITITDPANNSVFLRNDLITFRGTAVDPQDGNLSANLHWASSIDGPLPTGATIATSTLSVGTHTITASATDQSNLTGQAQIIVRVRNPNAAPQITISAPTNNGSSPAGTAVTLTASATDDFDGNISSQIVWTSSISGNLGTGASLSRTLVQGAHTLTATITDSDHASNAASVTFTVSATPPVVTISAPAAGATVFAGTPVTFTGSATDATDGNVSASLVWSSNLSGQIGTGPTFSRSDLAVGTHTITVSAHDNDPLTGQAQRTLIVRPPNTPPSITITNPVEGATFFTGTAIQLTATATDAENGNLASAVRWTSSVSGNLGTGSPLNLTSLPVGSHTITAAVTDNDNATSQAVVHVVVGNQTLTFTATADTWVNAGSTSQNNGTSTSLTADGSPVGQILLRFAPTGIAPFAVNTAVVRMTVGSSSGDVSNAGGSIHKITNNTWSEASTTWSNRPTIDGAALSTIGTVTTNQVVNFTVTSAVVTDGALNFALDTTSSDNVLYRSREFSTTTARPQLIVTLKQNTAPVVTITQPAAPPSINPGSSITFAGTATDAEHGNLSSQIAWSSSLDGALGTGASITVSSLRSGQHTITASATDPAGKTGTATIIVNVGHAPAITISEPANNAVIVKDTLVTFRATADDFEQGDVSSRIVWNSSLDGPIGPGGSTVATSTLRVGTHVITAAATDDTNLTGQSQISIRIRNPNVAPQIVIDSPASGSSTPAGTTVTLTAHATDDFDGNLTSAIAWNSNKDGSLGSGGTLTVQLSEGQHTLTAAVTDSDNASNSTQITFTVTATNPVVTITAPPVGTRQFVGTSITFTGTAQDATDGNRSASLVWTSDLQGPIGTGASFSTTALQVGTHVITAVATDTGGLTGQAQRTVVIRPPNVAPTLTINTPIDGDTLFTGSPISLTATATDVEDGNLASRVQWSSSINGPLGQGSPLSVSTLSAGTHVLTATVTDLDNAPATAAVTMILGPQTLTLVATEDTYADSAAATTNNGSSSTLNADGSPVAETYLRFAVNGIAPFAVQSATLRMTVGSSSGHASASGGSVRRIIADADLWSEASTTWNTARPNIDGPVLATAAAVAVNQVVNFDVTPAVIENSSLSFALTSTNSDVVTYISSEGSPTAGRPQLIITLKKNTKPTITITAPAPDADFVLGAPVTFTGTATDTENGNLATRIQWSSSKDGPLGSGASITTSSLTAGAHVVTARVTDTSGASAEATVAIYVSHPPVVQITAPANGRIFFTAELPVMLTGTATDIEDGDLGTGIHWTSSLAGNLGTGPTVNAGLAVGTHVITASVTDSDSVTRQAQITIRVREANVAPVVNITTPANGGSTPAGTVATLIATAIDDFDGDIGASIRWTSSLQGDLGTGPRLDVVLREGQHTLTASATDSDNANRIDQIGFTVTPTPPVVSITSPAAGALVNREVGATFTATATDATDGNVANSLMWRSDIDGPIGVGGSFTTTNLSVGTHVVTAEATDAGGLHGSAQVSFRIVQLPVVTILLPVTGSAHLDNVSLTFFADAVDAEDGDVSASLVWTSNVDGVIGFGRTFSTDTLSVGVHTVTARATDSDNLNGQAQVTFSVAASTLTFEPTADTYVDSGAATSSFGTATELQLDASPIRQAFLRFVVSGIGPFTVDRALLDLTVTGSTGGSDFAGTLNSISSNTWSETTTYNTRPAIDGPVRDSKDFPVVEGDVVTFTVTTAVTGNSTYNFALSTPSSDVLIYRSRQATTGRPRLRVFLAELPMPQLPTIDLTAPVSGSTFFDDETITFQATASDTEDGNLTNQIQWRSNLDGPIGTGGTLSTSSLSRGTHTVTASIRDSFGLLASQTVTVTIVDRPPAVVITAPADNGQFPIGYPITLRANATDDIDGDIAPSLVWTSLQDGSLGTGREITLESLPPGDHEVTAKVTNSLGTMGAQTITLFVGSAPPRIDILAPTTGTTVAEGTPITLVGSATDLEDGNLSSAIAWSSDRQGFLGTGASLPVTLTVAGAHRIRATVTDSHGFVRFEEITVTLTLSPPVVTITSPADGSSASGPVTFTGTAIDVKDGNLSAGLVWTSSRNGALGTGASVTANSLSVGVHVITATRTDSNGLTGRATITLAIGNDPPVVTITAPTNGTSRVAGQSFTFTGTASDTLDGNLNSRIVWSSNINGTLGTGASITTSTLARGTHVITARATDNAGISNTAQIQVLVTVSTSNLPPVLTITGPANGTSVAGGTPINFTATATDDLGGNIASEIVWVSNIDGFIGTGGALTTSSLSAGTHTITAAVDDTGGLIDSKTLTVTVTAPSVAFTAVADAYTDADTPNTNNGTAATLQGDATPVRRIFLRFTVSGVTAPITRALVRLQTTTATDANSPDGGTIRTVSNNTWTETTITAANAPAIDGATALASAGTVAVNQTVDLDVTPAVTGNGTYNFGITSASDNIVKYSSREAATGKPQLVLILQATSSGRPTVNITAPANGATLPNGTPTTFTATATDPQDGNVAASLVWTSNVDGQIGTGPSISRTLSQGVHSITARATDVDNNSAAALIQVLVSSTVPQVGIVSPAAGSNVKFGDPTSFIGTALDPQQGDISFSLTWSSNVDGPLGTGPSFTKLLSAGPHVITAQVTDAQNNTATATAAITVVATDVGYRDMTYPGNATAGSDEITSQKPESKLWYNDGVWWASLYHGASGTYHIHRLDFATQTWVDTGVLVDERPRSRQDILWDGQKLYVVSRFMDTPVQARFYRFSYFPGAKLYVLDPDYPVNIPGGASEALTVAKDSTGMFWITFTLNDKVWVAHSLEDDKHWSAAFVPPVPEGTNVYFDDISGVVALQGKIGVFWSNQSTDKDYFAVHVDGAPENQWTLEIAAAGSNVADDHFNMKLASDGRLFVAMKTSRDGANGNTLIGLLVRATNGTWSPVHQVMPNDFNPTRAQVLLDEAQRRVYVFYSPLHSTIHYKTSSMDTIAFPTGIGTPFIAKPDVSDINDPTSTKQNIDPSTGLVVLASNFVGSKFYYHNTIAPLPAPVVAITAPTTGTKRAAGSSITFTGTATSADLGNLASSLVWTSSINNQIGTGGSFSTSSLSAGLHTITASVTDARGVKRSASIQLTVEANVAPLVTITSPQSNQKFLNGATITFTGSALDSIDGDRTSSLVWTSSLSGQIGTGGTFTRNNLPNGTHVVTARATDTSNLQGTATVTIIIENSASPTITVTAPTNNKVVAFGAPLAFTGTASDGNDGDLTSVIAWTSNLDGNIGQGGNFIRGTLRRGNHVITARVTDSSGLQASTTRAVQVIDEAAPVVTITQPATGSVFGDVKPIAFAATAVDAIDGNVASTLVWTSNRDGQIGTGPSFSKSGLSVGTHVITASAHDSVPLTDIAQITIEVRHQPAPTVTITAPANNAFILSGESATFTATATDTVDGNLGAAISWTSSIDGNLGTGASITRTLSRGTHTITASATNSGMLTGTATISVVVQSAPVVGILAPTDASVVAFGDPATFTALATDFEDGDISNHVLWTSSIDNELGTGSPLTVVLSRGVHTITATATDNSQHSTSAHISVKVSARPALTITAPANNSVFGHGPVTLTGVATDTENGDLSTTITWRSNLEPGTLGTGASITVNTLRSGTHTITARVTDSDGLFREGSITVVINDLPVVNITTPSGSFPQGTPATIAGTATDTEDGTISNNIAWTSDKDGPLGNGSSVTSSTLSVGLHNITARITDSGGRVAQATRAYTILAPPTVTITGPASGSTFEHGAQVVFTGTASDTEDGNISANIQWLSNINNSIGFGATLALTTLSSGTHTITALITDQHGLTDSKQITITVNSTPSVSISAPVNNATFEPGASIAFSGTASDFEQGNLSNNIVWSAAPGGALGTGASVSTSALAAGSHVITASITDGGGKSSTATVTITVNATPTVQITAPANDSSFEPGATVNFTGAANDAEQGSLTANLSWQSNRDGSLGTGGSVSRNNLSTGTHTITASVSDSGGKTGSAQITVVIDASPTVQISAPADGAIFIPGASVNLTGTASDPEDGNRTGAIVWTSNLESGSLGTGGNVSITTLRSGTHTITATVSDTKGKTATAQRTVVIEGAPAVTITSPDNGSSFVQGTSVSLVATATDPEDGDRTASIVWTSNLVAGNLGQGGSVSVSDLPVGSHVITATATDTGGRPGSSQRSISITGVPLVNINSPADGGTFQAGGSIAFTGTANDTEDGSLTANLAWVSNLDGPIGTGGSFERSDLTTGTHTITASATDAGNNSGSAHITLTVDAAPMVSITAPTNDAVFAPGETVILAATASDPEDGDLTHAIVWTSDLDGEVGTGGSVSVTSLRSGTHTLTATVRTPRRLPSSHR